MGVDAVPGSIRASPSDDVEDVPVLGIAAGVLAVALDLFEVFEAVAAAEHGADLPPCLVAAVGQGGPGVPVAEELTGEHAPGPDAGVDAFP